MAMSLAETRQAMQAYASAHGGREELGRHFSDDVTATVRGTDQRYQGRDVVADWIAGSAALGEIRVLEVFAGEGRATIEAEFRRRDGVVVPYVVVYDLADGRITALRLYFTGPVEP